MARNLPFLAAFLVLSGTAILHGLWTDRWGQPAQLQAAADRLEGLPGAVGAWQSKAADLDAASVVNAGAAGSWARRFVHRRTGAVLTVILLCGRAGRISVHRPEHCYRAAGYEMDAPAVSCTVDAHGVAPAEFWTARFRKLEPDGPVQLRIYWSWFADGTWKAPENPRLVFARFPVLYKLYVVREESGGQEQGEEPSLEFLRAFLPQVGKALTGSQRSEVKACSALLTSDL